jgi:hypothetical protein
LLFFLDAETSRDPAGLGSLDPPSEKAEESGDTEDDGRR